MVYSGNPATSSRDAVRFWLQDVSQNSPLLSDDEIDYFVGYAADYSADPLLIASGLCTVVSAKYAGETSISGDGITYSGEQLQQKYGQLRSDLESQWRRLHGNRGLPTAGGISWSEYLNRYDRRPALFALGMNDNIRGASQLVERRPALGLEGADDFYGTGSYFEGG